jgi:hypothetical protein
VLTRGIVILATSVALGLGLAATPTVSASASAAPPPPTAAALTSSASAGAGYLARQIDAGGGHIESFGAPDVTNTAYAVLGLHAAGVGAHESDAAIAFLKTQLANLGDGDGHDSPGALGYVIMAAVASRQDPRHFGGSLPVNDLVARLLATERTSGPDTGLFGATDPTFDGAFRQGVALAALAAAKVPNGQALAPAVWLVNQQCANGLWTAYRPDVSVACPAANPNTFVGPDTNSTAMAVQGLAAFGVHWNQLKTLVSLLHVQSSDGGFPDIAAAHQSSDPSSTALVIQAFLADNYDPTSAVPALASKQLGCAAPLADRGAYFFPPDRSVSLFATVDAVPAAARQAFPLPPSSLRNAVPLTTCPPSSATPPTPATSATAATPKLAVNATIGTAGPCPGKTGVTVSVDFTAFKGKVQTRCAPGAQTSGLAAMQHAGFTPAGTTRYGLAFVCRINGLPTAKQQACVQTPLPNAFWAYYHALAGATTWTFSSTGASSYKPPLGSIDAWAFGNSAKPSKTPAQIRAGQ